MKTLRYNVLASGRNEEVGGRRNLNNSVFFYAIAEPYRGFNFNLGVGKGFNEGFEGQETESTTINFYSTITPHRTLGINLIYNDRNSDIRDPVGVEFTRNDSVKQVSMTYRPVPMIYLSGSYRLEDRPDLDERTTTSYAFNWSPFPGGRLRFNFGYNETQRSQSEFETRERNIVPSLRWDITNRSFLDVAYRKTTNRTTFQRNEIDTISGVFRFGF
jgi:hypothetical protein